MKVEAISLIELRFVGEAKDQFDRILKIHIETHVGVTFIDLLKLLYQSILGSHHIFDNMKEDRIKLWIKKNLKTAKPANRPLTEELYGYMWIRVDLGAFKEIYGDDHESLTDLFMKGRQEKRGSLAELSHLMDMLAQHIGKGNIVSLDFNLNLVDLADHFLANYKQRSCPPIHHSKLYREKNPPYLVVPSTAIKNSVFDSKVT